MIVGFTLQWHRLCRRDLYGNNFGNYNQKVRKLKLQVQITVEGFVGGPDGDHELEDLEWDDKLKEFAYPCAMVCDTILRGRKMAEGFIPHFEDTANNIQAKKCR
jgi:hypothetical protein